MAAPPDQAQRRTRGETIAADDPHRGRIHAGIAREPTFYIRHAEGIGAQLGEKFGERPRAQAMQPDHIAAELVIREMSHRGPMSEISSMAALRRSVNLVVSAQG